MERALGAGSPARSNQAGWGSIWYHRRVELAAHTLVLRQWATCTDTHRSWLDERESGKGQRPGTHALKKRSSSNPTECGVEKRLWCWLDALGKYHTQEGVEKDWTLTREVL